MSDKPEGGLVIRPSVIEKDGQRLIVWWQPEPGVLACCRPGCNRLVAKTPHEADRALCFTFPSRKEPERKDLFYFCSWSCIAIWVMLNDDARRAITISAEAPKPDDMPEAPPPP